MGLVAMQAHIYKGYRMAHTRKTGVPTLLIIAQQMCKYILKFTPVITQVYPSATALHAALAAANAACMVLGEELAKVREYGD